MNEFVKRNNKIYSFFTNIVLNSLFDSKEENGKLSLDFEGLIYQINGSLKTFSKRLSLGKVTSLEYVILRKAN